MSKKPNVDDYLQQGIYGAKEIKPEERNRFLGTLRERVVIALTQSQVREPGTYHEVEQKMKANPEATLYLNGMMSNKYLADYRKLANQCGNRFTSVRNQNAQTDLGLVLAYDHAVDHEDIYIEQDTDNMEEQKDTHFLKNLIQNLFK